METANDLKKAMVSGLFNIYAKGLEVPEELKALETEVIKNIALPLFSENLGQTMNAVGQAEQMAMMMQQAQQGGEEGAPMEEGMEEGMEGQMQEQEVPQEEMQEEQITETEQPQ